MTTAPPAAAGPAARGRPIMVVDDSRMQRRILSAQLSRAGHQVIEAASAEEALALLAAHDPDIILSDWMMSGQTGLDLCRAIRALGRESYVYFILLTSKTESAEIAAGLEMGADDFLTKPVSGDELRARIAAGRRILGMEGELRDNNRLLGATLGELQGLYDSVNRDLLEARKLQQSLVRETSRSFGNAEVTLLLQPSGHVGGDLVGFFPINARRVGLYALDVSGHGITSALMTARLAGYLSGTSPEQNIALVLNDFGIYDARAPADLAAALNSIVLREMQTENYFTLAYADVDLVSGRVALVQAGHPHPAVMRQGGQVEFLGAGGLPVGLIEGAVYDQVETTLGPGDKLFIMSDGLTEAADPAGRQIGQGGLARVLSEARALRGAAFLQAVTDRLDQFTGGRFDDDMSAIHFEFDGPKDLSG